MLSGVCSIGMEQTLETLQASDDLHSTFCEKKRETPKVLESELEGVAGSYGVIPEIILWLSGQDDESFIY